MTILFYKDAEISPNLGGIARINYTLSESLRTRGYVTFFLAAEKKYPVENEHNQLFLPDSQHITSNQNIAYVNKLLLDNNVDIIINNVFNKSSVALLDSARKNCKSKLITWIHNNIVEYASLFGYRKEVQLKKWHLSIIYKLLTSSIFVKLLRYLGRTKHQATAQYAYFKSDKVVLVCNGNIDEFIFLLGHGDNNNKIIAISNFIPSDNQELDLSQKEKIVVWCGAVNSSLKKTNWMLQIWQRVEHSINDWELYIIGDSNELNSMQKYAKSLNLKHVNFTGRITPKEYYRKASILCSTSITESFGLTILEGMQQKAVPIAFASSASIKEIIKGNGILVKPYRTNIFSMELTNLMKDAKKRLILSEKCFTASKKYEEDKIIKEWETFFSTTYYLEE